MIKPAQPDTLDTFIAARERANASTIWEGSPTTPIARDLPAIPIEAELLALLASPLNPGERHREGHDRKEHEIAALFDRLTPIQSLALDRRLGRAAAGDPLTAAFERLVPERRRRLRCYLARQRMVAITLAPR